MSDEISYDPTSIERARVVWLRAAFKGEILDGKYKGTLDGLNEEFRLRWPEVAAYIDKDNKKRTEQFEHAPAVLTPEEVAQVKGEKMPANKPKCVVCEETVRHANTSALYCSHRCAAKAAGALKVIRLLQPVTDRALRFLSGLNLQDHTVKEQREQVEITNQLVNTLRPKRGTL